MSTPGRASRKLQGSLTTQIAIYANDGAESFTEILVTTAEDSVTDLVAVPPPCP